ncbi:hypothetical protein PMZ80_009476 [Knufia obscura]|uniref:Uncharacterized protein n=2 Tax=Knufia TaxID=430999 RepID=A0AAN8F1J0_9EURO|nr:hypothetical protein PMZ80_009476 [Knufia obscura]KAK5949586.1 hypothetical protein OHC33_009393 [Knufia fluminis]
MSRPITVPTSDMSEPSNQQTANAHNDQPSMVGGHLNYIKGAAASALGYESGEQTKQAAVEQMREANKQSEGAPAQSNVLGGIEKAAGNLTGCEGMQNEGQSRQTTDGRAGSQTG